MDKFNRLDRNTYYLKIAQLVSQRSTCERAQVGAVLVYNNRIVSTGYNGSIAGEPHCTEVGCLMFDNHCIRTIHAEMNALLHLEHSYVGLSLYCTHEPCKDCFKNLWASGVKGIYFLKEYADQERDALLKLSNVILHKVEL